MYVAYLVDSDVTHAGRDGASATEKRVKAGRRAHCVANTTCHALQLRLCTRGHGHIRKQFQAHRYQIQHPSISSPMLSHMTDKTHMPPHCPLRLDSLLPLPTCNLLQRLTRINSPYTRYPLSSMVLDMSVFFHLQQSVIILSTYISTTSMINFIPCFKNLLSWLTWPTMRYQRSSCSPLSRSRHDFRPMNTSVARAHEVEECNMPVEPLSCLIQATSV